MTMLKENVQRIPAQELAGMLTAPVSPGAGRQLLAMFKQLNERDASGEETARLYRRAYLILDNLSFMDGASGDSNAYAKWFHTSRKTLMRQLIASAEALDPK